MEEDLSHCTEERGRASDTSAPRTVSFVVCTPMVPAKEGTATRQTAIAVAVTNEEDKLWRLGGSVVRSW